MDDELFSATILEKLPLADAAWRVLHFTLADSWLEEVWDENRGRCYSDVLQFSTLANLIAEALTQHGGSGRQTFERAREAGTLQVAISSAFEKLGNLPLNVSEQLLEGGTHRLQEVLPKKPATDPFPLPKCWDGHAVFGLDGKAIKHVKRLLKVLRDLQAGILGARSSVVLNLRTGMAIGMAGDLDGEAGEGALTEKLLPNLVAEADGKPWIAVFDRLYCNLSFPRLVLAAGGHFLIRYCTNTQFIADPNRPAQESRDAQGQWIVQEWGRLGKSARANALYVRRITLHLADGKVISVITDLLDETKYPADDLLATYQERWGIEKIFHQVTDVFSLKKLIGTSPEAVLFQFSLCLLMYNTLQVVRTHLASHQNCEAKKISNEKLFYDVKREMISLDTLVERASLPSLLGTAPTSAELRDYLEANLEGVWSKRWWKAPSSKGGGHKKPKQRVAGNHTSTYRAMRNAKMKE
jgi:hypothetical protein